MVAYNIDNEIKAIAEILHKKIGMHFTKNNYYTLKIKIEKISKKFSVEINDLLKKLLKEEEFFIDEIIKEILVNVTGFFRQKRQFNFLSKEFIENYIINKKNNNLKILSCGSSTGEEVYSIIISLKEGLYKRGIEDVTFKVVGIDYSNKCIKIAEKAEYLFEKIKKLDDKLIKKYFLEGIGSKKGLVKLKKEVRKFAEFHYRNIKEFEFQNSYYDIIFFRNVMIYFDKQLQKDIIKKIYRSLKKNGYLFTGYSEALLGFNTKFKFIRDSIYKK